VAKLQARLAEVERKLEAALRNGGAPAGAPAFGGGSNSGARGSSSGFAAQPPRAAVRPRVKLDAFLAAKDSPATKELLAKWPQILQRVKEERVTVHAWLVDGEPAAIADGTVLVAFRNTIHRETTEKPANKSVIEGVLGSILGQPAALATVMQKEWQEAVAANAGQSRETAAGEELRLLPDDGSEPEAAREPLVEEALRLFGEDLVVIKDD
jgi:DNA polymerase-3 subunit gamma/tau